MTPPTRAQMLFVRSLADRKAREASRCFVVEGEKLVEEALRDTSGRFQVEQVWRRSEVGEATMARMTHLSNPSPALAVVRRLDGDGDDAPEKDIASAVPEKGLLLGLDGVRDPGNMGTLIRLADWFGVAAVFASPESVDFYNSKVVQATMGAIFRVPLRRMPLVPVCDRVHALGGTVYGTFLKGECLYGSVPPDPGAHAPLLVLAGSESHGIGPALEREAVDRRLFIPPFPTEGGCGSESLNVAVATGIVLSEFRRGCL